MAQLSRWIVAACLLMFPAWSGHIRLFAQAPAPAATAPDDSKEPFVIERLAENISFQNDGTFTEETTLRVRIQSAPAVQRFGVLRLPYASAVGDVELIYARVLKPDGTVVATPPESILDMPAAITREAPFYSDLKEKQIAVKGLGIGDILEYQTRLHVRTPLIPGQFWFAADFPAKGYVLDQELQISVPRDRYVNLKKSPGLAPVTSEDQGRRIYTWTASKADGKSAGRQAPTQDAVPSRVPAVQLTTFRNWDQIAQWYRRLQETRVVPTPEIRAKALELTQGAASDAEKVRRIYDYVATKFRYIGIAFGIGRYQSHAAAEVLNNGYGDCKDKHTLLAALLAASGIPSYPALLHSSREIDPDVPAPSQFNHVITVVPQESGLLWLDSTTEIAPLGYLTPKVRDAQALVVFDSGPARLIKTPASPPFHTAYHFRIEGTLDDQGTLEAQVESGIRGDMEFQLRGTFHRMPEPQWKDFLQAFVGSLGLAGSISNVEISSPEVTERPLHLRYHYAQQSPSSDWADKRIPLPLPRLRVPNLRPGAMESSEHIALQSPGEYSFEARIDLPKNFLPRLPQSVDVEYDFAEYHAAYSLDAGVFHARRRLVIHALKIPRARRDDYLALRKAVNDDERFFRSPSAFVSRLIQEGRDAMHRGDLAAAVEALQAATSADPTNARAWSLLGYVHALRGAAEQGIGEMWKAIDLAPSEWWSYRELADMLAYLRRYPEGLETLQRAKEISPNNLAITWRTAQALLGMKRPGDAVAELLSAVQTNPGDARLALMLGRAYIVQGEEEKAMSAFQKVLEFKPTPANLNAVAHELADSNVRLEDALRYAQRSIALEEEAAGKISLQNMRAADMVEMIRLVRSWDTAGLVHFRLGNLQEAEKYLMAAWKLVPNAVAGDHLGQLYEKLGRVEDAARFYSWSLASDRALKETGERLAILLGSKEQADAAVRAASIGLEQLRTVMIPRPADGPAKAAFFVGFTPDSAPSAAAVQFIAGSNELRGATDAIASASYDIDFPGDRPAALVRQGNLTCDEGFAHCKLVFVSASMVNSFN